MRIDYVINFVSDMKKSVAFYRDVLGLPLKFETPGWTEFATDGATLALHASDVPNPKPDPLDHLPAGRCRSGFTVPNLDQYHAHLTRNNVTCIQPPRETFGARIALYVDPDGLVLGVSEMKKA